MGKPKIKWKVKAFRALRNDPKVKADLVRRGNRIATAAGPGFEVNESEASTTRARVYVQADTAAAARKNASEHTLLAALDAGRD